MTTALCRPGTKRLIDGEAPSIKATGELTPEQWFESTLERAKRYKAMIGRRGQVGQIQPPVMQISEARRQMDNLKRWLDEKDGYADPDPFGPAVFRW